MQIEDMELEVVPKTGKGTDFFSEDEAGEFYGDNQFSDDEFDPEGFEFSEDAPY